MWALAPNYWNCCKSLICELSGVITKLCNKSNFQDAPSTAIFILDHFISYEARRCHVTGHCQKNCWLRPTAWGGIHRVLSNEFHFFCRPRLKPNGVSVLTRNSERLAEKSSLSLSNKNSQRSLSLLSSLHFRSGFIFSFIWLQGRKELTLCRVEFCRHFW